MSWLNFIIPYFSADDWFHLRLVDIHSFREFFNFFSFLPNPQSASFYRPLSTQVFFFVFNKLFGLNTLPYHLFGLALFFGIIFLLYKFVISISDKRTAVISTLIYAISVTNFTRLFFLSAYQELFLVFFSLLCLITFNRKKYFLSVFCFILALLSKETAIVLPFILLLISKFKGKVSVRSLLSYFGILGIYLYLRLIVFKGVVGDSYSWNLSPFRALNTLFWYTIWSFGGPELLVDYVGSGLRVLPRFFTDYPIWSYIVLSQLVLTISSFFILVVTRLKNSYKIALLGCYIFIISLLPVLFLPWHKFTLELGLPLIGFAISLASLINKSVLSKIFIWLFIIFNLSMWPLTYSRNYAVSRGVICKNIITFLQSNYPQPPSGYFEFINDTGDYGEEWGSSKQIANAMGGSELFRVFYHDPKYQVYFEDIEATRPSTIKIPLSTNKFLSNTIEGR